MENRFVVEKYTKGLVVDGLLLAQKTPVFFELSFHVDETMRHGEHLQKYRQGIAMWLENEGKI